MAMLGFSSCGAQSGRGYADMDVDDFARYAAGDSVQVLDVRTPAEYADGHIAGAVNIDIYDKDFMHKAEAALDKTRPIAVYCRSGKRSADAAARLAKAGYQVTNLKGGILAWQAARLPIEN